MGTIGFHVKRASNSKFDDAQTIGYVPATGPDSTYTYLDRDVTPSQPYWYWLVEDTTFGEPDTYGPVQGGVGIDSLPYRLYLPIVLSNASGPALSKVTSAPTRSTGKTPDDLATGLLPPWFVPRSWESLGRNPPRPQAGNRSR